MSAGPNLSPAELSAPVMPPAPRRAPSVGRRRFLVLPLSVAVLSHLTALGLGVLAAGAAWLAFGPGRPAPTVVRPDGAPLPDPVRTPPQAYPWTAQPDPAFPIPPYARHLKGVHIVLDPGHLGQREGGRNWKRGPTGLRETEVNHRVSLALREFLLAVGARVTLTREVDRDMRLGTAEDLKSRADVANAVRADLLLSIHHNAADNAQANYTSVFYHRAPDHSRASLDAARHLLAALQDALRLERDTRPALINDHQMYPNDGFGVLRHARVPAVLTEASFYSNPQEEQRLRDPVYTRREAYGLFLGLARWARDGLPRVVRRAPTTAASSPAGAAPIVLYLDDGLGPRGGLASKFSRIPADSIVVRLLDVDIPYSFDPLRHELRLAPSDPLPAGAELFVDFENVFGQHVLHPYIEID